MAPQIDYASVLTQIYDVCLCKGSFFIAAFVIDIFGELTDYINKKLNVFSLKMESEYHGRTESNIKRYGEKGLYNC